MLHYFYNGEVVTPVTDRGKRLKVINMKRVKAVVQDEAGKMWEYRISGLIRAEDQSWSLEDVPRPDDFVLGEVVEFTSLASRSKFPGLYVVCATSQGNVRVALLGGEENRYIRAHAPGLRRVPLDEAVRTLAAEGLV